MIEPIVSNITMEQGYKGEVILWRAGDWTGHTIKFGMKDNLSDETEDLTKLSTGIDELSTTYLSGMTMFTISFDQADTTVLTAGVFEYNIWAYDNSERVPIFKGKFILNQAVVTDAMSATAPTYITPAYTSRYMFMLTPPDTFTTLITPSGFDGTLSVALDGDVIVISSTEDDFDNRFGTDHIRGYASEWRVSASEYRIRLAPGWETGFETIIVDFFKKAS